MHMENQQYLSEIHRLLKLGPDLSKPYQPEVTAEPAVEQPIVEEAVALGDAPFDLPYAKLPHQSADDLVPRFTAVHPGQQAALGALDTLEDLPTYLTAPRELSETASAAKPKAKPAKSGSSWGAFLVYPLVFALSFGFFYVVLNFSALMLQVQGLFAKDEAEQILQSDLAEYNSWIGGYFFAVGEREKLEPNSDIDSDGLTNLDEFTIKTNPTVKDSDSDGISDGIEVINGTNPWGTGGLTAKQKKAIAKLDMIKVNNRISFSAAASNGSVAGLNTNNFDLTKPGRLSIPKLNMQVPLIWTDDPVNFDNDLTRGVVHYPGTALPGENGMVYVSGHSSDYFWKSHPYKQVFARINSLETGDDVFMEVYGKDGKIYNYRYRVTVETIYAPDDQRQFTDNSGAKLNLSTCWPIGTQKDRYVVTAELVGL